MCGIISYFTREPLANEADRRAVRQLLWVDSVRGFHSTGIIYKGDDGEVDHYKKAVNGLDFQYLPLPNKVLTELKTPYFIGHNRAATLGAVNHSNAHPFEMDHILGVHNGTLRNHQSLIKGATYPVDSMCLYHAISEDGAAEVLPKVDGAFNLIWHDSSDDTIHICRNTDRPYTFMKVKGRDTLFGASEKDMLKWILKRNGHEIQYSWSPKDNIEYIFDAGEIVPKEEVTHEAYTAPVVVYQQPYQRNEGVTSYPPVRPATRVEFWLDSWVADAYLSSGVRKGTWFGETEHGVEISIHACEKDEFDDQNWFSGTGYYASVCGVDSYTVSRSSVKVELDLAGDDDDKVSDLCVGCGEDIVGGTGAVVSGHMVCNSCLVSNPDIDQIQPLTLVQ